MADFFDENPYLRRYQVTPEQQRAYDRYVRSRMQLGAGADGSSVVAPRASIPDSLRAPLPVGAMQPNGFAVHPNPNAPTNMPVSPARMRPSQDAGASGAEPSAGSRSFGQQALDGISTDINWLETRSSKLLGGIASIPRALLNNADALAQYLGVPPRQLFSGPMAGPLADLVAHKNYRRLERTSAVQGRLHWRRIGSCEPDRARVRPKARHEHGKAGASLRRRHGAHPMTSPKSATRGNVKSAARRTNNSLQGA